MKTKNKSLIEIHIAVFLFGVAGLFGKWLMLPAMIIVLGRVFFSSLFLGSFMLATNIDFHLKERRHYAYLVVMGIILAVHWTTFFKSIQVATVAIGLLTFATFPVFVTFLEPYFFKESIRRVDIVIALVTFVGVALVVPKFEMSNHLTQGALWGMISSFSYAVLSMMNRKYVKSYSSTLIAFYEQFIATLVLLPCIIFTPVNLQFREIVLLVILGTVFTAVSHSMFINGLKNVKTQTAGIISSLEPVYGILFAVLLLSEIPTGRELLGGAIILGTVFYSTFKAS